MNDKMKFNAYTQRLRQSFPSWSKIRKDPKAIGSQFLAVVGLSLSEMEWMLKYAYDQLYIGTADINQTDLLYKARIPNSLRPDVSFRFSSDSHILHEVSNVTEFLQNKQATNEHSALQYDTSYHIDFTTKYMYVKQPFGQNSTFEHGYINLAIHDTTGSEIYSEQLPLLLHHVWNFFDEFGLLLDTPRLQGERNAAYKERILDVFRRPASSAYRGLLNGIARELGLVQEVSWEDSSVDLTLYHSRIDIESITVDNDPYPEDFIKEDESGRTVLLGLKSAAGQKKTVRYVAGVTIHELHDKEDQSLQNRLYSIDGAATSLLHYYVRAVRDRVPIMWGDWRWNQGFWNISDEQMSGYGYVPTTLDGSIAGWKRYTPREGK